MANLFTADTHFLHKNIITYCNRPYVTLDGQPDVEAQVRGLIEKWNAKVGPTDTVYHLGDFFGFANKTKILQVKAIREKLNGRLVLIKGNHDHATHIWFRPGDTEQFSLTLGKVWLIHIPPVEFDGRYAIVHEPAGTELVLCGHVHDKWKEATSQHGVRVVNVGCDVWDWEPKTAQELQLDSKLLEAA